MTYPANISKTLQRWENLYLIASESVSFVFENDGNVVVHQSTVLKKMMYYTMRVRRAQRQFDELKAKLRQQRKNQIQLPEERIHVLTHMLRNVSIQFVHKFFFCATIFRLWHYDTFTLCEQMECGLSHVQSAGKKSGVPEDLTSDFHKEHSREQRLQHKLDTLKDRLKFWERRLEEWVCILYT